MTRPTKERLQFIRDTTKDRKNVVNELFAEIDALEKEIKTWRILDKSACNQRDIAIKERDQLRGALEKILDINSYEDWSDANRIAKQAVDAQAAQDMEKSK